MLHSYTYVCLHAQCLAAWWHGAPIPLPHSLSPRPPSPRCVLLGAAKVHYGTSLANVDWLHGAAESLLTVTNLLIVLGLRQVGAEQAGLGMWGGGASLA